VPVFSRVPYDATIVRATKTREETAILSKVHLDVRIVRATGCAPKKASAPTILTVNPTIRRRFKSDVRAPARPRASLLGPLSTTKKRIFVLVIASDVWHACAPVLDPPDRRQRQKRRSLSLRSSLDPGTRAQARVTLLQTSDFDVVSGLQRPSTLCFPRSTHSSHDSWVEMDSDNVNLFPVQLL